MSQGCYVLKVNENGRWMVYARFFSFDAATDVAQMLSSMGMRVFIRTECKDAPKQRFQPYLRDALTGVVL